jgi:hypothetical protein
MRNVLRLLASASLVTLAMCSQDPPRAVAEGSGYLICSSKSDVCVDANATCALRTSGPLSRAEVEEASKLLESLDWAKRDRDRLRDASDAWTGAAQFNASKYGYSCCDNDSTQVYINLGTLGENREVISGILRARIERLSCRLRALGVDVARP